MLTLFARRGTIRRNKGSLGNGCISIPNIYSARWHSFRYPAGTSAQTTIPATDVVSARKSGTMEACLLRTAHFANTLNRNNMHSLLCDINNMGELRSEHPGNLAYWVTAFFYLFVTFCMCFMIAMMPFWLLDSRSKPPYFCILYIGALCYIVAYERSRL